jgi:hypothetical protein
VALPIALSHLTVTDGDDAYPAGFTLTVMNGSNYSRSGNTITPNANFVGTLSVPVRVNDGSADSNTFNLAVNVVSSNQPPVITGQTPNPLQATAGVALPIALSNLTVTDPDDTYPSGFTLTVSGGANYSLSGNTITPTSTFTGGLSVPVRVNDGAANSNTFNLAVNVSPANQPPVIVGPIPAQTGVEDAPFQLRDAAGAVTTLVPFFRDPNSGDTLTYQVTGLPSSLTANAATGQITGTPRPADVRAAPYVVAVTASDGKAPASSLPRQTFNLTISARDRADVSLTITGTPAPALVDTPVEWRFAVANAGPIASGGVALTAEFTGNPFGFTELAGCTVTPVADRQQLACTLPAIAAGTTSTLVLRGTTAQDGDVYVTGSVAGAPGSPLDPVAANNAAVATVHIARVASPGPAQQLAASSSTGIATGDVDGDTFVDVVLAGPTGVSVHLNIVDPQNSARRKLTDLPLAIGPATAVSNVLLADLDGDLDLDLVATNDTGGSNTVYTNGGSASFTPSATLGGGTTSGAASADFDGDGRADLVFSNSGASTVHLNRGGGTFGPAVTLGNDDSRDVLALDADLDGLTDLVFANANGPSRYYRNVGAGSFAPGVVVDSAAARSVATGDFNRDNRPDLVFGVRDSATGPPSNPVYQNNPGGAGSAVFVLVTKLGAAPTTRVRTADLDADGLVDVIALNTTGTHQVYRGNGAGGFTLHPVQFSADATGGMSAAKLSVDASIDIATGGTAGGAVFFNDGRGGLGRGDTAAPVIQLLGQSPVTIEFGATYQDAGATATDDVDGNITARIVTANPVNTAIVGAYTVSYDVMDSSGNAATRVTRNVQVAAREGTGGGGGGATGPVAALALLAWLIAIRLRRYRLAKSS